MSRKYIAARRRFPGLAQVLRAAAAFLSGLVGGVGRRVHLGGIVHESQRFGRGIVRVQRGERRGHVGIEELRCLASSRHHDILGNC